MTRKSDNREAAIEAGEKTYCGRPCKSCGNTEKYVVNWTCVSCTQYKTNNRSPEVYNKYATSQKGKSRSKRYRKTKVYKEVQNRWNRNTGYMRRYAIIRREYIEETEQGLTEYEHQMIINVYKEAIRLTEETGIRYHVDHIVPLADGGRHHPENLQILTAEEHYNKTGKENRQRSQKKEGRRWLK